MKAVCYLSHLTFMLQIIAGDRAAFVFLIRTQNDGNCGWEIEYVTMVSWIHPKK